jgi:GAF domain-containing protein
VSTVNGWNALFAELRDGAAAGRSDLLVRQALELGHGLAPGTVGCSVTQFDGVRYRTPVSSTELAVALDGAQYAASVGPCLIAARDGRPQRVDDLQGDESFAALAAEAREHGVRSSLSLPVAGAAQPTALNLYSGEPAAFVEDRTQAIAGLLARLIGTLSDPPEPTADRVGAGRPELTAAREQGHRVGEAVESVMRGTGLGRSAAFSALTARSQAEYLSIAKVAERELAKGGERHG